MKKNLLLTFSAAGVFSLLALGAANYADANHHARHGRHDWGRHQPARQEIRQDWAEIRKDRAELRRDQAELQRDQADLRRLYRSGTSQTEINNKRKEIHDGRREIAQGRRELREDYAELRRDRARLGYNNRGRYGHHYGWDRREDVRWGNGWNRNDRWNHRDRWGWRYDRD
ncbi:MAG: hypothetical protein FJ143_05300 [Deltaproteobacteria bacterium]|nr:hypothetical protein [Deltaproteobacteria bacterium]